jgi:RNA polymerase sigma-70 factor, ECF subfamily
LRLKQIENQAALTTSRFDRIFKEYRHRVYGFAYHYLNSSESAADVTQDVFVRLWKNLDSIDEDRMIGWLLRVTRNACVDAIRRRKAYSKRVETSTELLMDKADRAPLPDAQAGSALFQEHLRKALETLDEPHKSIVVLREIQEYKYEEISEVLGLPLNTVKVYLHRARKALRKELNERMDIEYVG